MKYCVFGAPLDTGNLGVSALGYSIVCNLKINDPSAELTLFDHGRGLRRGKISAGKAEVEFDQIGAVNSRRFYRSENLWTMRLAGMAGGHGNRGLTAIRMSDNVLDISGGDSFTDLYGMRRFNQVALPKLIALEQNKPLILLPQTYGPFRTQRCRRIAADIVKRSTQAWARDLRSFEVLKGLLGDVFDHTRHRCAVDVAFSLPSSKPKALPNEVAKWLDSTQEVVGINISGLMYHNPRNAREHYGFKADYNVAMKRLIQRFVEETKCKVMLVPHVVTSPGHYESDIAACQKLLEKIGPLARDRVLVAPAYENPCEVKWLISQFVWFCGMRMHSTIAGLSSGVPTAAVSYSPKTLGVFETCGQGEAVVDPCESKTSELVERLWSIWLDCERFKSILSAELPEVLQMASKPFERILQLNSRE